VLADELGSGQPSVVVSGSPYPEVNEAVTRAFGGDTQRVYTTSDLYGLEIASALMGCLAVGVGYAQRIGIGAGLIATLITRGVEDAAHIAAAAGGQERTLLGLAGYGDLLAAIGQKDRPEVLFGAALAEGKSVEGALAAAKLRVEAAALIPRVAAWSEAHGIASPIFQGLALRLREPIAPADLVHKLMASPHQALA
jgi:glycerol-3-phosphate dehydrogenase (NAD(P)+)